MKSILVGFGRIGNSIRHDKKISEHFKYASHAQVLNAHPNFDWVGVVDPDEAAREQAAKEWGVGATQYVEWAAEREPEFAVLAIPPGARLDVVKQLPSLKAVLVEKPMGVEGTEFLDYCAKHDIRCYTNFWRRGVPLFRAWQAVGMQALVGDIQGVFCTYGNGLFNNGSHLVDFIHMLFGRVGVVVPIDTRSVESVGCSGRLDDYHASFVLRMDNFDIHVCPLDYNHYREFSIDIWGSKARLFIGQESLRVLRYPVVEHRAMERQMEVPCDLFDVSTVDVSEAFYNVYSMIADDTLPRASMDVENVLNAITGNP